VCRERAGCQDVDLQAWPRPSGCAERGEEGGAAHHDRIAAGDELGETVRGCGNEAGHGQQGGQAIGVGTNPSTLTPMRDRISIGGAPSGGCCGQLSCLAWPVWLCTYLRAARRGSGRSGIQSPGGSGRPVRCRVRSSR
jgi:hypothetical protein